MDSIVYNAPIYASISFALLLYWFHRDSKRILSDNAAASDGDYAYSDTYSAAEQYKGFIVKWRSGWTAFGILVIFLLSMSKCREEALISSKLQEVSHSLLEIKQRMK